MKIFSYILLAATTAAIRLNTDTTVKPPLAQTASDNELDNGILAEIATNPFFAQTDSDIELSYIEDDWMPWCDWPYYGYWEFISKNTALF